jgi:hypothetical protein
MSDVASDVVGIDTSTIGHQHRDIATSRHRDRHLATSPHHHMAIASSHMID